MPSSPKAIRRDIGISSVVFFAVMMISAWMYLDANAFSHRARSTTQGTVLYYDETTSYNSNGSSSTYCTTKVMFTPPRNGISFTVTDNLCGASEGTPLEVLYNPDNPSTARTARAVSSQRLTAIVIFLLAPIVAFIVTIVLISKKNKT
jgi:hypothetical protein